VVSAKTVQDLFLADDLWASGDLALAERIDSCETHEEVRAIVDHVLGLLRDNA